MADVYRHIAFAPDELLGSIDPETGRVYEYDPELDAKLYVGWVDYDKGEVWVDNPDDDELIGYVNDNNDIIMLYDDDEEERLGFVDKDGKLHAYLDDDKPEYLGKISRMTHMVEGAAAILFFFELDDDEFYDDYDDDEFYDDDDD